MRTASSLGIEWSGSYSDDITFTVTVYEEDALVPTIVDNIRGNQYEHRTISGLAYRFTI
jgi:hypothetical protein